LDAGCHFRCGISFQLPDTVFRRRIGQQPNNVAPDNKIGCRMTNYQLRDALFRGRITNSQLRDPIFGCRITLISCFPLIAGSLCCSLP
jgi:hypothetical protein